MQRSITGFHLDDEQVWVAELECGHNQHVRHEPPWQLRPWVLTEKGRQDFLGARLGCALCDRRELPAGAKLKHRTPRFDETNIPAGLRSKHNTKVGVWAGINVLAGELEVRTQEPFESTERLHKGDVSIMPPGVEHEVSAIGQVDFYVELFSGRVKPDPE